MSKNLPHEPTQFATFKAILTINYKRLFSYLLLLFLFVPGHSQPASVISTSTSGLVTCPGCSVQDPAAAIDGSLNTGTVFNVNTALMGGWAGAVYGYATPLDSHSIISIQGYFTGTSFMSSNPEESVIGYIRMRLRDQNNTILTTYGQGNGIPIQLVDSATNRIIIHIVVPMPNVTQIEFEVGGFMGLIQRNFVMEEIWETPYFPEYVTRTTGMGYSLGNISLCVGCTATNPEYATAAYDPNSDYAFMRIPAGASTGGNHAYMSYDWSGGAYDGSLVDLWVVLERVNFSGASPRIIDEGLFEIQVTYDDSSQVLYDYGNPFLEVNPLFNGSGRFALRLDLDNRKKITAVEIRLQDPVTAVENALRIYSIFVEPTSLLLSFGDLSFTGFCRDNMAVLNWDWENAPLAKSTLEKWDEADSFQPVQSWTHTPDGPKHIEYIDTEQTQGQAIYRLHITNTLGQTSYTDPVVLHLDRASNTSWLAYPNPIYNQLNVQLESDYPNAELVVYDLQGQQITREPLDRGTNRISTENWDNQMYVTKIVSNGQHLDSKMILKK